MKIAPKPRQCTSPTTHPIGFATLFTSDGLGFGLALDLESVTSIAYTCILHVGMHVPSYLSLPVHALGSSMTDSQWEDEICSLAYALAAHGIPLPDGWPPAPLSCEPGTTPFGRRSHARFLRAAALAEAGRKGHHGHPERAHQEAALALSRRAFLRGVQARLEVFRGSSAIAQAFRHADRMRQWYYRAERAYKIRMGWVNPSR